MQLGAGGFSGACEGNKKWVHIDALSGGYWRFRAQCGQNMKEGVEEWWRGGSGNLAEVALVLANGSVQSANGDAGVRVVLGRFWNVGQSRKGEKGCHCG